MRVPTFSQKLDELAASLSLHRGAPSTHSTTVTCTYPFVQQHWDGKLLLSACTSSRYSPGAGKVAVVVASFLSTVSPPSRRIVLSEKITSPGGPGTCTSRR